jgi:hypothetical protein
MKAALLRHGGERSHGAIHLYSFSFVVFRIAEFKKKACRHLRRQARFRRAGSSAAVH